GATRVRGSGPAKSSRSGSRCTGTPSAEPRTATSSDASSPRSPRSGSRPAATSRSSSPACRTGTGESSSTGCATRPGRGGTPRARRPPGPPPRWAAARVGDDGSVYAVSLKESPRGAIVRAPRDHGPGGARARVIVPEQTDAIQTSFSRGTGLWLGGDRLYVIYQKGGPNVLRVFETDGRPVGEIGTAPQSAVDAVVPLASGDALVASQSLTTPPAWLRIPRGGLLPCKTALAESSPADFAACEVVRDEAVSPDGTRVPMTILRRRGV